MRSLLVAITAGLVACVVPAAQAQTVLPEINVVGKVAQPTPYQMNRSDVHDVSGRYEMSDGTRLLIKDRSSKLHFEVDGRKVELYPIGYQVYSTATRDVTLVYVASDSQEVVSISYVPTAALAQANPPRITLGAYAAR